MTTLTLNTRSGVLHASQRCAGADRRFHYKVRRPDGEELVGFIYLNFRRICGKCT